MVTVYRVAYESRAKPKCSHCCTDANHPWYEVVTAAEVDRRRAEKAEARLWAAEREDEYMEYRNIRLQTTTTEWVDL